MGLLFCQWWYLQIINKTVNIHYPEKTWEIFDIKNTHVEVNETSNSHYPIPDANNTEQCKRLYWHICQTIVKPLGKLSLRPTFKVNQTTSQAQSLTICKVNQTTSRA